MCIRIASVGWRGVYLQAGRAFSRLRCTELGMRSASRYLATVLRAMSTPSRRRAATMASSDSTCRPPSPRQPCCGCAGARPPRCGLAPSSPAIAVVKKYFSSKRAARGRDVFVRRHAAHGALVHLHGVGDIAQDQWPQMGHAVAEEAVLPAHDLGRHLQDGLRALLQGLHQPVGRRELLPQECLRSSRLAPVRMRAWKPWFTSTRGMVSGFSSRSHSLPSSVRIGARRIKHVGQDGGRQGDVERRRPALGRARGFL